MSRLAIIPARGGSKRIPRKNIKGFLGKPVISYSIEAALRSGLFDEVMVSTDDPEIAEVAQACGATVPFYRSEKSADDHATTVDVIEEVHRAYDRPFETGCCIYATAPFVTVALLAQGLSTLTEHHCDTVFAVVAFGSPIQRALKLRAHNVEMFDDSYLMSRSQDLEPAYHDAGMFYWYKTQPLMEQQKLWTANSGYVIVDSMASQDIDTTEDWNLAEMKYKAKLNG